MSGGDSGAQAGSKIGRTLELARKERRLSLKEAEEATKIRAAYLAELERENFDVLPAVYVQGSLRTYANFLQLDGEAMVRELKRRQAPQEEHPYPLYVGPQEDDSLGDILTALDGAAGTKSRDATEDKRPTLLPAGIAGYLYLGSAVVLVLAVAALALTFAGDGRPSAVSQVREPLISQAPETSPPGIEENASAQQPEREEEQRDEEPRPERPAGSEAGNEEDEGGEQASQTGQNREEARLARNSASATAPAAAERDAERAPATVEPPQRDPASVRAPARQGSTAPPSSPRPTGQPGGAPSGGGGSPSPRGGDGELEVRVAVGADDPVRLTGGPFDD